MATTPNEINWESVGNYMGRAVIKSVDHNHQIKHTPCACEICHAIRASFYVPNKTENTTTIDLCSL